MVTRDDMLRDEAFRRFVEARTGLAIEHQPDEWLEYLWRLWQPT